MFVLGRVRSEQYIGTAEDSYSKESERVLLGKGLVITLEVLKKHDDRKDKYVPCASSHCPVETQQAQECMKGRETLRNVEFH
ncbi:hypothetical protein TNCV_4867951 [Trichonephila clavipes]|nr:hypothetical protein TNCV_4867951 [Trichonephila clavipes]